MIPIRTLALLSGLLLCLALVAEEPPKPKPADAKPAPAWLGEIEAGRKAFEADQMKIYAELGKLSEKETSHAAEEAASKPLLDELDRLTAPAVESALKLVRSHAADVGAVETLCWIVRNSPSSTTAVEAAALLQKHHPIDEKTVALAGGYSRAPHSWTGDLLAAQLDSSDLPKKLRPKVMRSLAQVRQTLGQFPLSIADAEPETLARIERFYGKKALESLARIDVAKTEAEAVALLERLESEYDKEPLIGELTYGEFARNAIFEIRHLAPGKPAPEIEGKDTDGKPMKLSDYKGKVVLLSFWGTWCGPCMAAIPHERELAKKYEGKPFAIVGINSDTDAKELKSAMETNKISWRSFDCGEKGPLGPIPMKWNVTGWPTIILIDAKGVIRSRNVAGATMDKRIDALLKDAAK